MTYYQTQLPPEFYHQAPTTDWAFVFHDWGSWQISSTKTNYQGTEFIKNFDPTGYKLRS